VVKPRVLVLSTYYHPVVGGVEIHTRQLVQHLHAHGFPVEVVTKKVEAAQPSREEIDGVPVHRVGPTGERRANGKWIVLPAMFGKLTELARRFDVLVCIDYRGIGVAAIAAGRLFGRPVIAQGEVAGVLAGADVHSTSGLAHESVLEQIVKAPVRAIYRRADAIVCIGRDLEREALRAGVPRDRVTYLPHGIDLSRFRPAEPGERDRLRSQFGWPVSRPVVLFVGRLSVEKGVTDLLEAWRLANRRDAMLVLVGPDMTGHPWDAGASGRAFAAANGLAESVRFEGGVADPAPFYRAADVFVQPSHFEALGNTALEAMASGLPVISSGVGGLADFCVDNVNALVHEPRSPESLARAIERLLGDPDLRARLGAAGRRTAAEQFELHALLDRYTQLIESVVR
jgi:D-inositol-3-phosphate glycosyltransferase